MQTPVIHQTDLFHPYNDPDDHFDLACQYALSKSGDIDLKGVLIDYSVNPSFGDPSLFAVHQLNYITGKAVPIGIGLNAPLKDREGLLTALHAEKGLSGARMVLDILMRSKEQVAIHIVGSCRDIAAAAAMDPGLFREKCKGVYLSAGSYEYNGRLEYNVWVDPFSYSLMFGLPCPLYWLPCVRVMTEPPFQTGPFCSYYGFVQAEILPHLSPAVQNYFLYALTRTSDLKWLAYLDHPVNEKLLRFFSQQYRNMWTTAGILHGAGKTVLLSGDLNDLGSDMEKEAYRFVPISVSCSEQGLTTWEENPASSDRFILKIKDADAYPAAMTKAMKTLLCTL